LPETGLFICSIKKFPLSVSTYRLGYSIMKDNGTVYVDSLSDACSITVVEGDYYGSGETPPSSHGCCLINASWRIGEV